MLRTLGDRLRAVVSLVARPLAGRAFRSEPLVFAPGATLVWTIENQPAHSYLSVR
jgi:hypothetical protein